tara:strand:+ start:9985 stop:10674 length:690 start_codon:yes stop_codon:yes gene_type:complete
MTQTIHICVFSQHQLSAQAYASLLHHNDLPMHASAVHFDPDKTIRQQLCTPADILLIELDTIEQPRMLKQLNDESLPPSLVISSRTDQTFADALMAYGANGIIHKNEPVALLTKAIMRVAEGELWLDRAATGRIFQKMARSRIDNEASADLQKLSTLTRKERTITTLVGEQPSASGQSLAEQLNISEHTLRNHLSNIYAKLVISGRVELYAFAQKNSHHFPGSGSEHSV